MPDRALVCRTCQDTGWLYVQGPNAVDGLAGIAVRYCPACVAAGRVGGEDDDDA